MQEAVKPANEAARLAALQALRVLDTPVEERFERITRLARKTLGVSAAMVNLVDADRLWSKSCAGLDHVESPRSTSFCSLAILAPQSIMIVPDMQADARFADHPLVAAPPHMRFYAGFPLVIDQQAVGTLCVLDGVPRAFDPADLAAFGDLAALARQELQNVALSQAIGALSQSENRFRALAESAFEAIAINCQGRIVQINPAFERLFGCRAADVIGTDGAALVTPQALSTVQEHRQAPRDEAFEATLQRLDGSAFEAEIVHRAIAWEGQPARVTAVRDISERKAVERLKGEFLGVVSHDLKNPLGSLMLSLDYLLKELGDELPAEAVEILGISQRGARRLLRLVERLLDGERLQTGRVVLEPVHCPSSGLFEEVIGTLSGLATASGVHCVVEGEPLEVWADRDALLQVLTNLVGNAIKFSPPGGRVRLRAEARGSETYFEVADEGRGVPVELQRAIFERYTQVERADASERGGHGLGLPICEAIIRQHGGRIWVDSAPGQGSRFCFVLPAGPHAGDAFHEGAAR